MGVGNVILYFIYGYIYGLIAFSSYFFNIEYIFVIYFF